MSRARIVSSFEGSISAFVLALPSQVQPKTAEAKFLQAYGDLFRHMPPMAKCYWLVEDGEGCTPFTLHEIDVVPVPQSEATDLPGNFQWIQDPFLCLSAPEGGELVVPVHAPEADRDAMVKLASVTGCPLQPVDLCFEGGNILACGDYLLVGLDLAAANGIPVKNGQLVARKDAWERLETSLENITGQEQIVWLGSYHQLKPRSISAARRQESWQPFFHIDLLLMPGGRTWDGRLRFFLGRMEAAFVSTDDHTELEALQTSLDQVEAQLRASIRGVEIIYLPLVALLTEGHLQIYSFCNGVMSWEPDCPQVFLPTYDFENRKSLAARLCESAQLAVMERIARLGIRTRFVRMGFAQKAQEGGALHCVFKVLSRS